MINISLIKYSLESLRRRRMRSSLTVLSVLIGITAITALISFGLGISTYVQEFSQKMGSDKLIIQPRGFSGGPPPLDSNVRLDETDLETIRDVPGVQEATGVYALSGEIEMDKQKKYSYVFGLDFDKHKKLINEVYTLNIHEGSELHGNELSQAVLAYNYQLSDTIFSTPVRLRDTLTINGQKFHANGFYESVGNPHDDAHVYITKGAAEKLFNANNYQFILVRAAPGKNPSALVNLIAEELREHRNQKRGHEDFFVQTFEQVIATFTAVLSVITAVVILIALISVIVAAVNITNTMYTSILERTKEIGVMKAIGSKNKDILLIFVFESGLLSFIGGVLGVLLGTAIALFAGAIIAQAGYTVFTPRFTWRLIAGTLLFALIVGLGAGLIPAYRASKLNPVDSLRYE